MEARLLFWDGSLLEFVEVLTVRGVILVKTDYVYHHQDSNNNLIFRYDNAPHHPEIASLPHHKHLPNQIVSQGNRFLIEYNPLQIGFVLSSQLPFTFF